MEHEVVIPLPAELVLHALDDPALLARCLPGLSTEASDASGPADRRPAGGPPEITGRLKLRIGSSTITYRGVISLIRSGAAGVVTAFVEGQEARGDGEVTATLRIAVSPEPAEETEGEAARLRFTGDLTPAGRLTEFDDDALTAAGRRLLDRFASALREELTPEQAEEPADEASDEPADGAQAEPPTLSVVPDPLPDDLFADDLSDLIAFSPEEEPAEPEPVELPYPHAVPDPAGEGPVRRSIVGRSAEEVDHAPPRGRYAPALPARSARARAASRWYGEEHASAAAGARLTDRLTSPWVIGGGVALLGGAVIVARALRRR